MRPPINEPFKPVHDRSMRRFESLVFLGLAALLVWYVGSLWVAADSPPFADIKKQVYLKLLGE